MERLAHDLADKGCLIEAGWLTCRALWVPPDAPPVQVDAMRDAFMAGAQHLWGSLFQVMDSGDEPTAAEQRRMELIEAELHAFYLEIRKRAVGAAGSA